MKSRRDLLIHEISRKSVHLCGTLIPIGYYFIEKTLAIELIALGLAVFLVIEYMRLRGIIELPDVLLRRHEKKSIGGHVYFAVAVFLTVLLFDKIIAIIAILMLSIGDTASGITGALLASSGKKGADSRLNSYNNQKRSNGVEEMVSAIRHTKPVEIILVTMIVCILLGLLVINLPQPGTDHGLILPATAVIAGAAGATIADAVPWRIRGKIIDDNITIPIFSAIMMKVISVVTG